MNRTDGVLSFLVGMMCGAVVGAGIASLFVPRSGPETREHVTERGIELKLRAEETVRKAQDVANETVARVQGTAQDMLQRRATSDGADATS